MAIYNNDLQGIEDNNVFLTKLTKHIAEIWENHCFREGNTRSVMIFTDHLVKSTGRVFDDKAIRQYPSGFREALKTAAFSLEYDPLKQILQSSIVRKPKLQHGSDDRTELLKQASEAKIQLNKLIDTNLEALKKPLRNEKTMLERSVQADNRELTQHNTTKTPLLNRSSHEKTGVELQNRLAKSKSDLYSFTKNYNAEIPKLRRKAAEKARKENPRLVDTINRWKSADKEYRTQKKQNNRSNTKSRSI